MPRDKYNKRIIHLPERLENQLAELLEYPCTVVTAPANFGKTTAVRECIRRLQEGEDGPWILWQTLLDNEDSFFWEDLAELFFPISERLSHLIPRQAEDPVQRRCFLKELGACQPPEGREALLIIDADGYDCSDSIREFFELLVKNSPPWLHLVLIGRHPLLKRDSRLYLYGMVHFIVKEDFRFSVGDIEKFYRSSGVPYSQKDAQRLAAVSEGWISVIRLNLMEYMETGRFLSTRQMEKIIDRTFFSSLPEAYQDFLTRVCICRKFTGEQGVYLFGPEAREILEKLIEMDLFLQKNGEEDTYQMENIFASCVRRRYEEMPWRERAERLNRAGDCFRDTRQYRQARQVYHQAQNYDDLMRMVEQRTFKHPYSTDDQDFVSYYADCPPEIRLRYPKAILIFAKHLINSDRRNQSEKVLQEFKQSIKENASELGGETIHRLEAMYELLLSYTEYNDLESMMVHLCNTEELVGPQFEDVLWPETGLSEVPSILYMYHRRPGELCREVALFEEYNRRYARFSGSRTAGAELVMRAEMRYMMGDMRGAEIPLYEAQIIANRDRQWGVWISVKYLQIRIEMVYGNWSNVERLLAETKEESARIDRYLFISAMDLCNAYVYGKLNMPQKLSNMFKPGWDENLNANFRAIPTIYALHAEVLLVRKAYIPLIALSKKYLDTARIYPNLMVEIILRIIMAGAYRALEDHRQAREQLHAALEQALPDGILMPFVEFGQYIEPILEQIAKTEYTQEITQILRMSKEYRRQANEMRQRISQNGGGINLTQQERKIAALVAEGYSNKEIADEMVISESTVKTHLAHVFAKLDVKKRSQLKAIFKQLREE